VIAGAATRHLPHTALDERTLVEGDAMLSRIYETRAASGSAARSSLRERMPSFG
jgi:hypothetical protein